MRAAQGGDGGAVPFGDASSRSGVDLTIYARQNPGKLLQSAIFQMQQFLAERGEANSNTALGVGKFLTYLTTVFQ